MLANKYQFDESVINGSVITRLDGDFNGYDLNNHVTVLLNSDMYGSDDKVFKKPYKDMEKIDENGSDFNSKNVLKALRKLRKIKIEILANFLVEDGLTQRQAKEAMSDFRFSEDDVEQIIDLRLKLDEYACKNKISLSNLTPLWTRVREYINLEKEDFDDYSEGLYEKTLDD